LASERRGLARTLRILPRRVLQRLQAVTSGRYRPPYSVLSVQTDITDWVLDEEAIALQHTARALGIRAWINHGIGRRARQCCHYTSQFVLGHDRLFDTMNRISIDYFHGRPGTAPEFDAIHAGLRRHHEAVTRLRVSHSEMAQLALETGITAEKVHQIPIAVSLAHFELATSERRRAARRALGLPEAAVVVGSFQKDGVGWDEGMEPKGVKGPDVLLRALAVLKPRLPELWVLLTGPARGFVRRGLEEAGVPYRHRRVRRYADMAACFHALDAYAIPSRQEGGPKALLEAMAAGVPVVSTRVGQAMDLVRDCENGWLVDVEDAEALAARLLEAVSDGERRRQVIARARLTAAENSHEAQAPAWARLFRGYVEGWPDRA
jgi:glycosyltransferase involved in cell wall biosynthesis